MSLPADGPRTGHSEVLAELAEIVRLVTGRPVEDVQPDRTFVDDLRIDSLAMVEILEGARVRIDVRIDDEDAKDFVKVGDLISYIQNRLGFETRRST